MLENQVVGEATTVKTISKTQCAACGAYFVGASVFDLHRVSDPHAKFGRRCMTAQEMQDAGLATEQRLVKFLREGEKVTEPHDVWFSTKFRDSAARTWG